MEILSINVVHHIWLLVEFLAIEVLDSNSYIIIKLKSRDQRGVKYGRASGSPRCILCHK